MRAVHGERGFTLVELLVAISVLGVIMGPLCASLIIGLRTTSDSQQRLVEARGAELTSHYFPFDVASATNIIPADPTPCGGAGPTVVASFDWADDRSLTNEVTYVVPAGATDMVRMFCQGGSLVSKNLLASGLNGPPTIACAPTAACDATFQSATITVKSVSGWQYTVTGSRRAA
jgi:prepilin-type N-terminal cleavage/methylation domain-containing protein